MPKKTNNARNLVKNLAIFFIIFLMIASFLSLQNSPFNQSEKMSVNTLASEINAGKIKSVEIDGDDLTIVNAEDKTFESRKESGEALTTILSNYGVETAKLQAVNISVKDNSTSDIFFGGILPILIPFLLIGGFIWFMMRQVQGSNNRALMFGQVRAKEQEVEENPKKRTHFKDVAGSDEAKEELQEVVEFLREPKRFTALGAKIPRGVLLVGPPGVGKTLMARAVAGEADVPFFHISGSEFVEMFVGVGASRVRDLFQKAKKKAPCIVFIDEIDAVGRQRGAGLGGSHDEREQTLNQILVEMDGFENETHIIVLAATNRPDILDPALLRPGRFDRQVTLDLPDIRGREAILNIHAANKPLDKDVDLKVVAKRTPGFSGADLANLLNEAAIFSARNGKKKVGMKEALESIEKVMLGPARKSHVLSEKEREVTAYHEAGHALVANTLPHADPVHKISIIPRGRAAGYTLKLPDEDRKLHTKAAFVDDMAVMLGGYVGELEVFGELTTGASNDLQEATKLARRMVTDYGMGNTLAPRTYGHREEMIFLGKEISERRDYSEKTAEKIDDEVATFIQNAKETAEKIIREKRGKLNAIAEALLKKETLERAEFEALFEEAPSEQVAVV